MNYPLALTIFILGVFAALRPAHGESETAAAEQIQPLVTTSELMVGTNRFAFGLLKGHKLLNGANVTLRVYAIDGTEATLAADLQAPYHDIGTVKQEHSVHRHPDGTEHLHGDQSGVRGLYVATVTFARAGTWGIEMIVGAPDSFTDTVRFAVTVLDEPATPLVGSAAPRSRNLVASDVKQLRQIDTSSKPDARLHQVRIADAITQGKPQLVVFATPQFCTSRMCGPVIDIVRALLPAYGKRVVFTHQEIWQNFADKKVFPTVEEWHLNSEPWIFIVDGQGIIRAKFEGLVLVSELEAALKQVAHSGAVRPR
jgi:hypothetical protein